MNRSSLFQFYQQSQLVRRGNLMKSITLHSSQQTKIQIYNFWVDRHSPISEETLN